jgi:hypothetical protein
MKIQAPSLLPMVLLVALTACAPGGERDGGPERKDAGVTLDSGPSLTDGGQAEGGVVDDDAGPPPADAGANDAGPQPPPNDGGLVPVLDAGPLVDDEAGDLTDPLDVTLPFAGVFDHVPAGDSDCLRFTVQRAGVLRAAGSNLESETCSTPVGAGFSRDIKLYLYADGETNPNASLTSNDTGGPGNCPLISTSIGAGTYILCSEHWSRFSPVLVYDATVDVSFAPFVCGNGIVELGEECDGVENCTGECLFDDGLPRENEALGNGQPGGPGVLDMELRQVYRGQIDGSTDVDWWRLDLPGGFGPGAVEVYLGGPDVNATSCGAASGLRLDLFGAGDFTQPAQSSRVASPCRVATLTKLLGDIVFGNELLYVRVSTAGAPTPYHLYATYIEEDCGDGVVQPSEECEPGVGSLGTLCNPNTCRLQRPSNDLCNQAEDITASLTTDGTIARFTGNTTTATNATSYTGTGFCQSSSANHVDVHYTFVAPATGKIAFVLDSIGWDAVLYATENLCGAPLVCRDTPEEIELDVVQGQRYTVVIDGYSTGKGAFTLGALYLVPPPNNTCVNATTLVIPADGSPALATGSTRSAANNASSTGCGQSSAADHRDVFYTFTAPTGGSIKVALTSNFSARIYARTGCGGSELACGTRDLTFDVTAGGTYVIVVDAFGTGAGEYDLSVRYDIPPPPLGGGETCNVATPLVGPWGLVEGTLTGMSNSYNASGYGNCTGYASDGPDTAYTITVPAGASVQVNVDFILADGALYIVDACPLTSSSCIDGDDRAGSPSSESVRATNSSGSPKTYWVIVDEYIVSGGTPKAGKFNMEWIVSSP